MRDARVLRLLQGKPQSGVAVLQYGGLQIVSFRLESSGCNLAAGERAIQGLGYTDIMSWLTASSEG